MRKIGDFNYEATTTAYGLKVRKLVTPNLELNLASYPPFTLNSSWNYSMLAVEPERMKFLYLTDTTILEDSDFDSARMVPKAGKRDELTDEWFTDGGLQFANPQSCGVAHGIGQDNTLGL